MFSFHPHPAGKKPCLVPPPPTATTEGFASHIHLAPLFLVLTLSQHAGEEGGCCRPHSPSLTPYHSNGLLRLEDSAEGSSFLGAPQSGTSSQPAAVLHQGPLLSLPPSLLQAGLPSPCCRSPSNLCPNRVGALGPQDPPGVQDPSPLIPRTPESEPLPHSILGTQQSGPQSSFSVRDQGV